MFLFLKIILIFQRPNETSVKACMILNARNFHPTALNSSFTTQINDISRCWVGNSEDNALPSSSNPRSIDCLGPFLARNRIIIEYLPLLPARRPPSGRPCIAWRRPSGSGTRPGLRSCSKSSSRCYLGKRGERGFAVKRECFKKF